MRLYTGCVENRQDPLKLGRCQVRVVGLHNHDKNQLKTEDLPWAYPLQPVTSAAISGIGHTPIGPVEGTWVIIMFRDEDEQQPIMLGTIGGIPQSVAFDVADTDQNDPILKDVNTGVSVPVPVTEQQEKINKETIQNAEKEQKAAEAKTLTTDIPTDPPPEFKTQREERKKAIQALLAACDKFGITSREVKCSILAMAGGESGYIPADEGYSYSTDALKQVFYTTFSKKHPELAEQYSRAPKKGITREEFFDFVYAPENNGSGLGNTQTGDGGKYFGRGLTGITGRYSYGYYGNKIGVDLLTNPGLLTSDLTVSAQASAMMIWDNTKKKFPKVSETANPDYFYAAKKAQGNDANAEGAERRLRYYEYFYGNKTPSTFTEEKSADPAPTIVKDSTVTPTTGGTPSTTKPAELGFKDPNNKYPLQNHLNEPDTNRLARGISKGTYIPIRDANRVKDIPIALGDATFSEPESCFAAKYPYNHVFESESGHVQEFDDTPGHERIMTYHRKGTFTEIDYNGSEIHHIVGDGYTIIERNGSIYIAGNANVTVDGNINILCKSSANIEVTGDADVKVGGDADLGIAKNARVAVGDSMELSVANNLNIRADNINIEATTAFNLTSATISESSNTMNVAASNYFETVGTSNYRWEGDKHTFVGADTYERHDGGTDYGCPSDPSRDGSDDCGDVESAGSAIEPTITKTPPDAGTPMNPLMPYLVTTAPEDESLFLYETDDEWQSEAGIARKEELIKKNGPANEVSTDSTEATGGSDNNIVASCSVIYGTQSFTNDFRLSEHFTLGMLIDGGVNGHNKLQAQMGLTVQQIVCNLSQLCQNILEPMLAVLPLGADGYKKTWKINSGFRIADNIPAGGVKSSDHMYGRAIDFTLLPYDDTKAQRNYELAGKIEKILPYDQIIMEYMPGGSNWVHIGYRGISVGDTVGQGGANRKMAFTMVNGSTYRKDGKTGFYLL